MSPHQVARTLGKHFHRLTTYALFCFLEQHMCFKSKPCFTWFSLPFYALNFLTVFISCWLPFKDLKYMNYPRYVYIYLCIVCMDVNLIELLLMPSEKSHLLHILDLFCYCGTNVWYISNLWMKLSIEWNVLYASSRSVHCIGMFYFT